VAEPTAAAPQMRWWGWGDPERAPALPPHALGFLRDTVGVAERPAPPVALEHVRLDPPTLSRETIARLRETLGADAVQDSHGARVLHASGKGYPDLVRMRAGEPEGAPDAVLYPSTHEQVRAVLELCARSSLAVVPFGGGTSVVGGVAPLRGEHSGVVALDMARMGGVVALDRHLSERGLTLGHYPQSFEYVSLGGCAATRSAGQASTGYGSIEKLVLGMRLAAPAREIELPPLPASAAGPSVRQLLIGSEGTLGVISEVSLRVRPAPAERIYEGMFFEDFLSGSQALRTLAREHALPDVARLSDEHETRMSLALAGSGGVKGRLGRAYLGARGYGGGCLAIFGFEGSPEEVASRRGRALELARGCGGLRVGRSPGAAWLHGRFGAPYLRDELLTLGVMVETLETATQWSNLARLHRQVADAISAALDAHGTPGLVMCHVSHVYETGASLYFTLIARQSEDDAIGQWRAVKRAAGDAIVDGGGTITHHHAVGRDHAPWMAREIGDGALDALRAVKAELDPAGIMNPGKLFSSAV